MKSRIAAAAVLAVWMSMSVVATAQSTRVPVRPAAPTIGPVAVRTQPGSVLQPDGRRKLLLTATSDIAMCGYQVWRGRWIPFSSPSWSLLSQRALPSPTTAFRFADSTPSAATSQAWYYRVQATGCDGLIGPSTQVDETFYGVIDDDDSTLSLSGPTSVVTNGSSFGGTYQVARGVGAQVSLTVSAKRFVALYAQAGPTGGVANVFFDGVRVGRASFYAQQAGPSTAVWVHRFPSTTEDRRVVRLVMASPGPGGGTDMTFDAVTGAQSVYHGAVTSPTDS